MRPSRIVAGIALALVLVVALPTAVSALWSSRGTTTASVAAGRVQYASSGFEALAAVFGSTEESRVAVSPVTVRNTGTVPAPFTLQLGAETANNLARAVKVSVWLVRGDADCTAATAVPEGVTAIDWPVVPAVTGLLAPTESAVYCVRSVISEADVAALPGDSMVATLRLTSAVGSWTHEASARAIQSVAHSGGGVVVTPMPAPIEPAAMDRTESSSDTGAEPSDGADSEPVPSPAGGAASNDSGSAGTGADGTGPVATADDAGSDPSGSSFSIVSAGTTWCADAGDPGDPASAVVAAPCDGSADQSWRFSAEEDGYRRIAGASDASPVWTARDSGVSTAVESGGDGQRWVLRSGPDGSMSIVSRTTGDCVTVPAPSVADSDKAPDAASDAASASAPDGADHRPLVLAACVGSPEQDFTLTAQS